MESHQQAHDSADGDLPEILEHPLVPANEPTIIHSDDDLHALLQSLREAGSFGYDTEFIGEHTYYPQFCVIQVATADRVTLIDPLASLDLTPFWTLLTDPAVEKIVHAGVQDLEPAMRFAGKPPQNLFDVQIASAFIGVHYPSSLINLVAEVAGADLGHGAKFSQWDRRPLSSVQMQYAANDVRYLPLVRSLLGERLDAAGNSAWAAEECASLTDPALYINDPASQRIRVRGVDALGPRRKAVLRALMHWRDATAREVNMPPRAFIKDVVLYDMARAGIKSDADLEAIRGLPRPVKQHYADAIVTCIAQALERPLDHDDRARRPSLRDLDVDRQRINRLWENVEQAAAQRSIHPAIVTSKKELTRLVYAQQLGHDRASLRICNGWRAALLRDVLDVL